MKKWTSGRWRQTCTLREYLSNSEALSLLISLILLWMLILILQPLQTFVELARFERVMTSWTEFHFSLVYTFSATPRSVRIWAPVPPRETGCDPALPAQLCWSSSSSFPHRLCDSLQNQLAIHHYPPVKGQRPDNLAFFSVPWRFCTSYGCFIVFDLLIFAK